MSKPEKAYLQVIKWIGVFVYTFNTEAKFAVWEIALECNISRNTTRRILQRLKELRYVNFYQKGFAHRQWRASKKWTDVNEVIEDYEIWRMVR